MKLGDIAKAVIEIGGGEYDSLDPGGKDMAEKDVQFVIDNPGMTPGEWHKMIHPDTPYKTVKAKDKAMYKTTLATIQALKGIQSGSDEKGDFVECDTIEEQEPAHHPNRAVNWGEVGPNSVSIATKSTPKNKPEGF